MANLSKLVVPGTLPDILGALRAELTAQEFEMLRLEPVVDGATTFRKKPSAEQSIVEVAIIFMAQSAASGIAWDLMRKVIEILANKDRNKDTQGQKNPPSSDDE